jgi:RNA polymerase sigma factor (sigma-70 family)
MRFIKKRMGARVDAGDIAQETYIRLLRMERQDLIRDPRPYVYRIAANLLYEAELKRRASAGGMAQLAADFEADLDQGVEDAGAELTELRERLESALQGLPPKCRAALILHRCEQMTYEEIAVELGVSTTMVKRYLARGLKHCREELKDMR